MDKPKRDFNTKVTYYLEDFSGKVRSKEVEVDLATIPDEELDRLIFHVPEATSEIVYRELYGQQNKKTKNQCKIDSSQTLVYFPRLESK